MCSVDVFIGAFGLVRQYSALKGRTRALRSESPEGFSLAEKEEGDAVQTQLAADWATWEQTAMVSL
jgi:hypothetical protein